MLEYFRSEFRPITIGQVSANPTAEILEVERDLNFSIPEPLREILIYFGGAIIFENEVMFRPMQTTGLEDAGGFHGLEVIYGVSKSANGLREKNVTYRLQLPQGLVPFAESAGGNIICIEKLTGRVIFWHHEASSTEKSTFEIARNLNVFFNLLAVGERPSMATLRNIVKGKSFLDF